MQLFFLAFNLISPNSVLIFKPAGFDSTHVLYNVYIYEVDDHKTDCVEDMHCVQTQDM